MSNNPLISVIVPIYNTEKYLKKCIESIINQTYTNLEIILVNDGSTDNSLDICEEYKIKDDRVVVINQHNCGVSRARNAALECANGELIGFVDSDDFIDKTMFDFLYNNMKENNCDVSICSFDFLNSNNNTSDKEEKIIINGEESIINLFSGKLYSGHLCNKLFKSSIIKHLRFDENVFVSEDALFVCEALCNAQKVIFQSKRLYCYCFRGDSACKRQIDDRYYTVQLACEKLEDILERNKKSHLMKFSYAYTLNWNVSLLDKLFNNYDSFYARDVKKRIRKYIHLGGLKYLPYKKKIYLCMCSISINLYFFIKKVKNFLISKKD